MAHLILGVTKATRQSLLDANLAHWELGGDSVWLDFPPDLCRRERTPDFISDWWECRALGGSSQTPDREQLSGGVLSWGEGRGDLLTSSISVECLSLEREGQSRRPRKWSGGFGSQGYLCT